MIAARFGAMLIFALDLVLMFIVGLLFDSFIWCVQCTHNAHLRCVCILARARFENWHDSVHWYSTDLCLARLVCRSLVKMLGRRTGFFTCHSISHLCCLLSSISSPMASVLSFLLWMSSCCCCCWLLIFDVWNVCQILKLAITTRTKHKAKQNVNGSIAAIID